MNTKQLFVPLALIGVCLVGITPASAAFISFSEDPNGAAADLRNHGYRWCDDSGGRRVGQSQPWQCDGTEHLTLQKADKAPRFDFSRNLREFG